MTDPEKLIEDMALAMFADSGVGSEQIETAKVALRIVLHAVQRGEVVDTVYYDEKADPISATLQPSYKEWMEK